MFHSEAPKNDGQVVHVVTYPGENLGKIASWYTGSRENWKEIGRNNPQISTTRLRLGDRVLIPNRLLVKTAAMPQAFVAGRQGKEPSRISALSSMKGKSSASAKDSDSKKAVASSKSSGKGTDIASKVRKTETTKAEPTKPESAKIEVAKVDADKPEAQAPESAARASLPDALPSNAEQSDAEAPAELASDAPEEETSKSQKFVCRGESCEGLKARTALLPSTRP